MHGCPQRGHGLPPWIFTHSTDKVEEDLMMLFFGLVFLFATAPPPGNSSADDLCSML